MSDPKAERKYTRLPVKIPAGVIVKGAKSQAVDAEITNISEGGAFVHCTAPIRIGEEVMLEIRFAETRMVTGKVVELEEELQDSVPENQTLQKSVVKWARGSSKSGFGVEFVGLEPENKNFVEKLVKYFEQLKRAGVQFDEP